MTDLNDLAARCEEGSGGDRELDWEIAHAARGEVARNPGIPLQWLGEDELPSLTSSLGAAVSFVERALPEHRLILEFGQMYASATIVKGWGVRNRIVGKTVERPDNEIARAVIACALRALRALAAKEQT